MAIDRFFFYKESNRKYNIDKSILNDIKSLSSNVVESPYYSHMTVWKVDNIENIQDIYISMQLLSMSAVPNHKLIQKYNLIENEHLVRLLRRLYLEIDDDKITMGYKRPFGNSTVEYDVREERKVNIDDCNTDNYDIENLILKNFSEFIIDFYKNGFIENILGFEQIQEKELSYLESVEIWKQYGINNLHPHLIHWKPSRYYIRKYKLENIFKYD